MSFGLFRVSSVAGMSLDSSLELDMHSTSTSGLFILTTYCKDIILQSLHVTDMIDNLLGFALSSVFGYTTLLNPTLLYGGVGFSLPYIKEIRGMDNKNNICHDCRKARKEVGNFCIPCLAKPSYFIPVKYVTDDKQKKGKRNK